MLPNSFRERLVYCQAHADLLAGCLRGVERENLRVDSQGRLAQTRHPSALGSPLTHPFITLDFSESLLELVTAPMSSLGALQRQLELLDTFVHHQLQNEYLWPASMPGWIPFEEEVRLADFGTSLSAQVKRVYRQGLSYRYGRRMQAIAGIHYNFSFSNAFLERWLDGNPQDHSKRSQRYLEVIRNFYDYYPILPYLFGASPACMVTSLKEGVPEYLKTHNQQTYLGPFATSLRMSELGYHSLTQQPLRIQFSSIQDYADSLIQATRTSYPDFSKIGVRVGSEYRQLSDAILQIENEYYSPIRPKPEPIMGLRPALALKRYGVAYLEVRVLDLNPFVPLGIEEGAGAFVEILLLYCFLLPKKDLCCERCDEAKTNFWRVATQGRRPDLFMIQKGQNVRFYDWAHQLLENLFLVAQCLDSANSASVYTQAIEVARKRLLDPDQTPSAQMLQAIEKQGDYDQFILSCAKRLHDAALKKDLSSQELAYFESLRQQSMLDQQERERSQNGTFEEYLCQVLGCQKS